MCPLVNSYIGLPFRCVSDPVHGAALRHAHQPCAPRAGTKGCNGSTSIMGQPQLLWAIRSLSFTQGRPSFAARAHLGAARPAWPGTGRRIAAAPQAWSRHAQAPRLRAAAATRSPARPARAGAAAAPGARRAAPVVAGVDRHPLAPQPARRSPAAKFKRLGSRREQRRPGLPESDGRQHRGRRWTAVIGHVVPPSLSARSVA